MLYFTVVFSLVLLFAVASFAVDCEHKIVSFEAAAPDCNTVGYTEGEYCIKCNTWLSGHEIIPAAHSETEKFSEVKATCTEKGYTEGTYCHKCQSWIEGHQEIDASHKDVQTRPAQEETCTLPGYTAGVYCNACDTWLSGHEEIPASHKPVYVAAKEPTCTLNGYTEGMYCPECKNYLEGHVEIPFVAHKFTEKIIDRDHLVSAATPTSPAVYRFDCENCSAISETLTFTYGNIPELDAAEKIVAAQSTDAIKLTWTAVRNADGYVIFYRKGDQWKQCAATRKTTVTFSNLKAGSVFTFAVKAYIKNQEGTIYSKKYSVCETATKSEAPEKIISKQNFSAIGLAWSKCRAHGYRIYYKSADKWKIAVDDITSTSYIFKGLPSGKSYIFAVRPYIITKSGVVWGNYSTFTAATLPVAPKIAAASLSKGTVSVQWGESSGAEGYQLYYKVDGGKFKLYKNYYNPLRLDFSSAKSGSTYTFAVRPYKRISSGYIFGDYNTVSVKIK
ncbi:MAG: fibronectin type III domain-containing protein [Acutalibacteraceae bacterium]